MSVTGIEAAIAEVKKLTQQEIVALAKREHAKIMVAPPRPASYVRHVDGRIGREEDVKPGGVIVYDYNRLDLVAKIALQLLREFSPVLTGEYRNAHRIIMDTPDEVRITNTVAYSRVIEVGKRGSVKLNFRNGGAHVYERVWRRLKNNRDVGNSVNVKFAFTESAGASPIGASREAKRSAQWPTLIITSAI